MTQLTVSRHRDEEHYKNEDLSVKQEGKCERKRNNKVKKISFNSGGKISYVVNVSKSTTSFRGLS